MKYLLTILIAACSLQTEAQVLNKFVWDSSPLTKAAIGPDAISVSSIASLGAIAAPLNFGINPGLPKTNIDLVLAGATFDVPSIDIDVFFRTEETVAGFFKRGSVFDFGVSGSKLYVKFTYKSKSTGLPVVVNSGNVYTMPSDHAFHEYTFRYDSITGVATLSVDKVSVYSFTGEVNSGLYWTGAGNAVVGDQMDGTGTNVVVLSQLTISTFANSTLPTELTTFSAALKNHFVSVDWTSVHEVNILSYEVQRSSATSGYVTIRKVSPRNGYTVSNDYKVTDSAILNGVSYYRLKMIDKDGSFKYSAVAKVSIITSGNAVTCFPNPASSFTNIAFTNAEAGSYSLMVTNLTGQIIKTSTINVLAGAQQLRVDLGGNIPGGNLIVTISNANHTFYKSFKVVKA